jgi:hypothetical protein
MEWWLAGNVASLSLTPTSLVPMAARAVGLSYEDVVARTLELAAPTAPQS